MGICPCIASPICIQILVWVDIDLATLKKLPNLANRSSTRWDYSRQSQSTSLPICVRSIQPTESSKLSAG